MSSSTGVGDSQGQEGHEKKFNAGKAFIKRLAYRIRGGGATPETNASQVPGGHEDLSNGRILDEEEEGAPPNEPETEPNPPQEIERSVSIAPLINAARYSYFHSGIPQFPSQLDPRTDPIPVTYLRGADRHERTQRLLAKYGLSVEAQDWMPANSNSPTTVLRVEKQVRMRVRYTCHMCEHLFGVDRNCKTCNHKRCEKCPRHPSKRGMRREETDKENLEINTDVVTSRKREHEDVECVTRSRSRGKHQAPSDGPTPVIQLLHYSCHKCKSAFEQRGRLCSSCGHIRCPRCPRNLADYSENGEDHLRPERVHRLPRQRIRYICDHCESTFREGSKVCGECLHKRCKACRRIP